MKKIIYATIFAIIISSKPVLAGTGTANDLLYLITSLVTLFLIPVGINYIILFFRKNNLASIRSMLGKFDKSFKKRLCISPSAEENSFPSE